MKYKIGDKVRIRKDLVVGEKYGGLTYYSGMDKEVKEKGDIVIIDETGTDSSGVRWYSFEGYCFSYTDEMIEDEENPNKFEAFLKEVANPNMPNYVYEWNCLRDLVHGIDVDENMAHLAHFYETFNPKVEKKLTMAELREIVGEDFEIVD